MSLIQFTSKYEQINDASKVMSTLHKKDDKDKFYFTLFIDYKSQFLREKNVKNLTLKPLKCYYFLSLLC